MSSFDNTRKETTEIKEIVDNEEEQEIKWTDDKIRWEDDNKNSNDNDNDNDEEEEGPSLDPFKDPDPTQSFSFNFDHPSSNSTIKITLDGFKAESDEIWTSTGLTLWRASEHLCHYLQQNLHAVLQSSLQNTNNNDNNSNNQRILELGAGLGLVGIFVHYLLITPLPEYNNNNNNIDSSIIINICLTDGDTHTLKQLRKNIKQNITTTTTTINKINSRNNNIMISCRQLLWGKETSQIFLTKYCNGQTFDILLASDIVYVAVVVPPLWETVQTLLSRNGKFIFAYCSRRHVPVTIDFVLEAADKAGFTYQQVDDRDGVLIYIFEWKK